MVARILLSSSLIIYAAHGLPAAANSTTETNTGAGKAVGG
jgi:hypothetical protein